MAKKTDKDAKSEGKKKDKKGKGKKAAEQSPGSSIATHARARHSVRQAKGWVGLAGFAIAAVLSLQASVPLFQVGERALAAGVVGYMLAWWCSVLIWRQLIVAEQRAAIEELERRNADTAEQRPAEAQPTAG
jgi:hypothetical protein